MKGRRQRDIIIKVIEKDNSNYRRIAKFFADKYIERDNVEHREKS
jgi:hypothetical protein